ncbi:MAG: N-acetylmuramoyl-L-alanine amidase [Clostridia bacterium]|nr:N-acetylmuramoyl-L-alanine amidase [Clostridia bacterium]
MKKALAYLWPALWLLATGCCALTLTLAGARNLRVSAASVHLPEDIGPSSVLAGLCIAIDAGHGGYDGGAVGRKSRVTEKELNLDVALRLRELLRAQGAHVILTRDGDYALCEDRPPIRKKLQDMQRRALLVLEGGAGLLLSIHMNEYSNGRQAGPQVFFREGCPAGKTLAESLQTAMNDGLQPARNRQANAGDYYMLTLGIPSALVECGFLSNAQEEALLQEAAYRERVARSVRDGVLAWAALEDRPEALPKRQR